MPTDEQIEVAKRVIELLSITCNRTTEELQLYMRAVKTLTDMLTAYD